MRNALRIVVALPDPADRLVIREAVREIEGVEILGYAGTGMEAVQMNAAAHPDAVLLATELPVMDGCRAARMISLHSPATRILLASSEGGNGQLRQALAAGACGLLALPLEPEATQEAIRELSERDRQREEPEFVQATDPERAPVTVAVCGSSGGTGKTTLAVNIAFSLARQSPGSVALVDLYHQFGDVSAMLDVQPRRTLADLAASGEEVEPEVLRQLAVALEPGVAVFIGSLRPQPVDVFDAGFVDALLTALRQEYRFVVLDLPPSLHAGTLTALSRAEYVLVICGQAEVTAVASARGFIDVLLEGYVSSERLHVLLNRVAKGAPLSVAEIGTALGRPVAGQVPDDPHHVRASINDGSPAVLSQPKCPAAAAINRMVEQIRQRLPLAVAQPDRKPARPLRLLRKPA